MTTIQHTKTLKTLKNFKKMKIAKKPHKILTQYFLSVLVNETNCFDSTLTVVVLVLHRMNFAKVNFALCFSFLLK